jgi:IS30 family transposase
MKTFDYNRCYEDIENVIHKLNHHPRKCLDFLTPFEEFFKDTVVFETGI